jgi:hypothetical protein
VQTFLLSERLRKFIKTCSRKAFPINSSGRSLRAKIVLFEMLSGVRKRALSFLWGQTHGGDGVTLLRLLDVSQAVFVRW